MYNKNKEGHQVFIFHKTCAENRNKIIAEKIIESLPWLQQGWLIDKDDLSEVVGMLNQTMEEHLNTTVWELAKWLPIFLIEINENGENISQIGVVA